MTTLSLLTRSPPPYDATGSSCATGADASGRGSYSARALVALGLATQVHVRLRSRDAMRQVGEANGRHVASRPARYQVGQVQSVFKGHEARLARGAVVVLRLQQVTYLAVGQVLGSPLRGRSLGRRRRRKDVCAA